jgi:hypothetical protein
MNKKNQGIEVKLSVIAISAILVASLFVMGSSRFIPDAMAQNATNMTGGAANMTGAAAGGAANMTGGAANMTGAAAGGAANQTGAMVMVPQAAMTSIMDDIETVRGAVDEGDTEAVDALDNIDMQLRTAAGLPIGAEEEEAGAEEEEEAGAEEEEAGAEEEEEAGADEEEDGATP